MYLFFNYKLWKNNRGYIGEIRLLKYSNFCKFTATF